MNHKHLRDLGDSSLSGTLLLTDGRAMRTAEGQDVVVIILDHGGHNVLLAVGDRQPQAHPIILVAELVIASRTPPLRLVSDGQHPIRLRIIRFRGQIEQSIPQILIILQRIALIVRPRIQERGPPRSLMPDRSIVPRHRNPGETRPRGLVPVQIPHILHRTRHAPIRRPRVPDVRVSQVVVQDRQVEKTLHRRPTVAVRGVPVAEARGKRVKDVRGPVPDAGASGFLDDADGFGFGNGVRSGSDGQWYRARQSAAAEHVRC